TFTNVDGPLLLYDLSVESGRRCVREAARVVGVEDSDHRLRRKRRTIDVDGPAAVSIDLRDGDTDRFAGERDHAFTPCKLPVHASEVDRLNLDSNVTGSEERPMIRRQPLNRSNAITRDFNCPFGHENIHTSIIHAHGERSADGSYLNVVGAHDEWARGIV